MFKDGREQRAGQRGGLHEKQADPTLIQVLAAAAIIRMGWSEEMSRSRWQRSEWIKSAADTPEAIAMLAELD